MAPALPIFAAIGALISAGAAIKQGIAASDAADFNASQASENARLSRVQSAEDEKQFRVLSRKQLGDIKTGYAASGVKLEASATDVLEESSATAEADALKIRESGERKAKGYQGEATLSRMQGSSAQIGGYLSGAAELLNAPSRYQRSRNYA